MNLDSFEHEPDFFLVEVSIEGVSMIEQVPVAQVEFGASAISWDDGWTVTAGVEPGDVSAAVARGMVFLRRRGYTILEELAPPLSETQLEVCNALMAVGANPKLWTERVRSMLVAA